MNGFMTIKNKDFGQVFVQWYPVFTESPRRENIN